MKKTEVEKSRDTVPLSNICMYRRAIGGIMNLFTNRNLKLNFHVNYENCNKGNPRLFCLSLFLLKDIFIFKATTAPYFYGSILLRALKSEIIVLLTYVYTK